MAVACAGKMSCVLKPEIDWHKGKAVEWLLDVIEQDYAQQIVPIYIGDDMTDEDAFRVLNPLGGVGIFVGEEPLQSDTEASYYLEDPQQVQALLEQFVRSPPETFEPVKKSTGYPAGSPSLTVLNETDAISDAMSALPGQTILKLPPSLLANSELSI